MVIDTLNSDTIIDSFQSSIVSSSKVLVTIRLIGILAFACQERIDFSIPLIRANTLVSKPWLRSWDQSNSLLPKDFFYHYSINQTGCYHRYY